MLLLALKRRRGVSEAGRAVRVVRGTLEDGETYSITLVTSLTHPDGFVISNPRRASNSALDFLMYLTSIVRDGHLAAGDILVCDNAPVHFADDIDQPLRYLLAAAGARLLFLPTYSPELNPCELIFAQLKAYVRNHRSDRPLLIDVGLACRTVSWGNVFSFYDKCINRFYEY